MWTLTSNGYLHLGNLKRLTVYSNSNSNSECQNHITYDSYDVVLESDTNRVLASYETEAEAWERIETIITDSYQLEEQKGEILVCAVKDLNKSVQALVDRIDRMMEVLVSHHPAYQGRPRRARMTFDSDLESSGSQIGNSGPNLYRSVSPTELEEMGPILEPV